MVASMNRQHDFTPEAILKAHNCYRASIGRPAMVWNAALAKAAETSNKLCTAVKQYGFTDLVHDSGPYAQNLAWTDLVGVSQWFGEIDNCSNLTCTFAANTGHVLNMVRYPSVGCAMGKLTDPTCTELRCNYR